MNKMICLLLALVVLISLPTVFAEDLNSTDSNMVEPVLISANVAEDVTDAETMGEVQVMNQSTLGAEVRILQLQRASLKSVIVGETIISILSSEEDVNELEAIYSEIVLLNSQIELMDADNSAVDDYVAVKKDLLRLVQDFRTISRPLVSAEDVNEIKAAIDSSEELAELDSQIKNKLNELNAERVQLELKRMGVENQELIGNITDGNSSPQEIREALRNAFQNLSEEEKIKSRIAIKNKLETKVTNIEQLKQQIFENFAQKQKELLQKRLANADANVKAQIQANIANRVEALNTQEQLLIKQLQKMKEEKLGPKPNDNDMPGPNPMDGNEVTGPKPVNNNQGGVQ